MSEKLALECSKVSVCLRTAKSVRAKIQYVETAWKRAHDWSNETGQGVKETDPPGYDFYVKKLCRYYFRL